MGSTGNVSWAPVSKPEEPLGFGVLQDASITPQTLFSAASRRLRGSTALLVSADLLGLLIPCTLRSHVHYWLLGMTFVAIAVYQSAGLYRPRLDLSIMEDFPVLFRRLAGVAVLFAAAVALMTQGTNRFHQFAVLAAVAAILQLASRTAALRLIRVARLRGIVRHETVILGGGTVGARISETLVHHREYGLNLIGCVDDAPPVDAPEAVPYLGPVRMLPEVLSANEVRVLIVAFGSSAGASLVDVVRRTEALGVEVFVVPRLFEIHATGPTPDHIGAIPLTRLRRHRLNSASWVLKRLFDVAVSSFALIVLSPLLAALAIAVRIDGGPGVLFRQERIGMNGVPFELLKFRSMRPASAAESATQWSIANDNRVSRLGTFLRRTSLDELPQLINILRAEMSLVGPRPERPHFASQFAEQHPHYINRLRVPVGLTGLAQVSGLRGDTSISDRARYDNFYIENWSLWLDVKIILQTARQVYAGAGK